MSSEKYQLQYEMMTGSDHWLVSDVGHHRMTKIEADYFYEFARDSYPFNIYRLVKV